MNKTKIIVGLAVLTCAIAAAASPANAFFEAKTPGATTGPIAKLPSTTTFTVAGVVEAVCTKTASATGFWTIQNSEETIVTEGTKEQRQTPTKVGPHEAITITNWGECVAFGATANVSPCRLQVAQAGKNTGTQSALGSVQTDCSIAVPKLVCTILVPQTAANHNLKAVTIANTVNGVEIKANVVGITFEGKGAGCAALSLTKGTSGTFKTGANGGEAIETALQKLI